MDYKWLCHELDKVIDCANGSKNLSICAQDRLVSLMNIFIHDVESGGMSGNIELVAQKMAEVFSGMCQNPEALGFSLFDVLLNLFENLELRKSPEALTQSKEIISKDLRMSFKEILLQIKNNSGEPQTLARFKTSVKITMRLRLVTDLTILETITGIGSEIVTRSLQDNFQGSLLMMPVIIQAFPSLIPDLILLLPLSSNQENLNEAPLVKCLEIMCIMADHLLNESNLRCICLDQFFSILALGLAHAESIVQKRALYLLKRSIDTLATIEITEQVDCSKVHVPSLTAQKPLWNEYYLILESVDEKQGHIVKQILGKLTSLLSKTGSVAGDDCPLHVSWVLVVFNRLMVHNNQLIVKWTISFILSEFRVHDMGVTSPDFAYLLEKILLPGLNSTKMISEDVLNDSGILVKFESFITYWTTSSNLGDNAWSLLILGITSISWGPTPLFYVSRSLWNVIESNEENISLDSLTRDLVLKFIFKDIQNQDILCKGGTQELFLRILYKCCPCSMESLTLVAKHFGPKWILVPGSKLWGSLQAWVKNPDSEVTHLTPEYINRTVACSSNETSTEKRFIHMKTLALHIKLSEGHGEFFQSELWFHVANLIIDHADRVYSKANLDLLLFVVFLLEEPSKKDEGRGDILYFAEEMPVISMMSKFQEMLRKSSTLACAIQRSIERILFDGEDLPEEKILTLLGSLFTRLPKENLLSHLEQGMEEFSSEIGSQSTKSQVITLHLVSQALLSHASADFQDLNQGPITNLFQKGIFPSISVLRKSSNIFQGKSNAAMNSYSENILINQWSIFLSLMKSNTIKIESTRCSKIFTLALETIPRSGRSGLPVIFEALTQTLKLVETSNLNENTIEAVLDSGWKTCADFRRNEAYWPCCKAFVDLAFSDSLLSWVGLTEFQENLVDQMFHESEAVPGLIGLLAHRLRQNVVTSRTDFPILNHALAQILLFGSGYKKDQQLQCEIISVLVEDHLKGFGARSVFGTDVHVSTLVRSLGHEILSVLGPKLNHRSLILKLQALEKSVVGNKVRYFSNSQVHLAKMRVLQSILIMTDYLTEELGLQVGQDMISSILKDEFQVSVRYFTEWILIRLSKRFETLQEKSLEGLELAKQTRPGCVPSFLYVMSYCSTLSVEDRMRRILPWAMSQHFATRLCAQLVFRRLYCNIPEDLKPEFKIMDHCVSESLANGSMGKHVVELETDFYLTHFDPDVNFNPSDIFFNIPSLTLVIKTEWMWYSRCATVVPTSLDLLSNPKDQNSHENENDQLELSGSMIQKKITPWESMFDVEPENRTDLIPAFPNLTLVASLVDRVPNLGGLCRTSEILGVGNYVISNKKYLKDKDFVNLSVSSHNWVPISEVPLSQLKGFLDEQRSSGFTVVGIEQTSNSINLEDYHFPEKTVMVLGNEKEGIPVNLLQELDVCIEIPQHGLIRSFNVHVTGALVVWEYVKQHMTLKNKKTSG